MACKRFLKRCKAALFGRNTGKGAETAKRDKIRKLGLIEKKKEKNRSVDGMERLNRDEKRTFLSYLLASVHLSRRNNGMPITLRTKELL